jgi:hypothetical protein
MTDGTPLAEKVSVDESCGVKFQLSTAGGNWRVKIGNCLEGARVFSARAQG